MVNQVKLIYEVFTMKLLTKQEQKELRELDLLLLADKFVSYSHSNFPVCINPLRTIDLYKKIGVSGIRKCYIQFYLKQEDNDSFLELVAVIFVSPFLYLLTEFCFLIALLMRLYFVQLEILNQQVLMIVAWKKLFTDFKNLFI